MGTKAESRPWRLFWVETPSADENCFVVARRVEDAERLEEEGSGWDDDDVEAEEVLVIPDELVPTDDRWPRNDHRPSDSSAAAYASNQLLDGLGAIRLIVETRRVVQLNGRSFEIPHVVEGILGVKGGVTSVTEWLEVVDTLDGRWIFRGQPNAIWELASKVERTAFSGQRGTEPRTACERQLLERFKRRARPFLPARPDNEWEWMAIAQHHGVPTRLLDWTTNPLVALYFAVSSNSGDFDGVVYALRVEYEAVDPAQSNPFDIDRIEFYTPAYMEQRLAVQESVFTAEPDPCPEIGVGNLEDRIVRASAVGRIQKQLRRLGITEASLFPGLDAVGRELAGVR